MNNFLYLLLKTTKHINGSIDISCNLFCMEEWTEIYKSTATFGHSGWCEVRKVRAHSHFGSSALLPTALRALSASESVPAYAVYPYVVPM